MQLSSSLTAAAAARMLMLYIELGLKQQTLFTK